MRGEASWPRPLGSHGRDPSLAPSDRNSDPTCGYHCFVRCGVDNPYVEGLGAGSSLGRRFGCRNRIVRTRRTTAVTGDVSGGQFSVSREEKLQTADYDSLTWPEVHVDGPVTLVLELASSGVLQHCALQELSFVLPVSVEIRSVVRRLHETKASIAAFGDSHVSVKDVAGVKAQVTLRVAKEGAPLKIDLRGEDTRHYLDSSIPLRILQELGIGELCRLCQYGPLNRTIVERFRFPAARKGALQRDARVQSVSLRIGATRVTRSLSTSIR